MENYLIKLKYAKDMKSKNMTDFGFLRQTFALNKRKLYKTESEPDQKSRG